MLCIDAYRINSVYQKLESKGKQQNFGKKKNHNDIGTSLDFRQKNDLKNTTSLQRQYLIGKSTSKTQRCNNVVFWSEQQRWKHNVVLTLSDVATKRQPKLNLQYVKFIQSLYLHTQVLTSCLEWIHKYMLGKLEGVTV